MKAKLLILSLSAIYALFLIGCKLQTDEAKRLGLICINGHVFREIYEKRIIGIGTTTLEPLNITCENGKVELN
ncbi:hypothetical protein [Helicobacter bilis]|uniref:hypothetical protein n=1 Tax=Helicobacter bilis TaxID=37372 RepID=UPI0025A9A617|nr:hypothetical protein [Helicobacter bilis]